MALRRSRLKSRARARAIDERRFDDDFEKPLASKHPKNAKKDKYLIVRGRVRFF